MNTQPISNSGKTKTKPITYQLDYTAIHNTFNDMQTSNT